MNRATSPLLPPESLRVRDNRIDGGKVISTVVLIAFGFIFVAPMLWLILSSVDASATWQTKLPVLTLNNFSTAMSPDNAKAFANSLILSGIATVVSTVCAVLAAYSFSRHHIPWKGPILLFLLFLSGVPVTILIVPVYRMFLYMDWLSLIPTSILIAVTSLPFQIYMLKNSIDALPIDIEEAAQIERAKTHQILLRVVLPLIMPGVASAAIFGFVNAWGSFLLPIILIDDSGSQPAPTAIYSFISSVNPDYGALAAFSLIYSLPVVLLYVCLSRQFKAGFVLGGAVK
ncbi:carbohydrate ABC transporter permease [Paraburkholderia sp. EG285A]|uniref:carbohydrate ABC transporter permease n=1 Tax=Paraburkholderia sp. EG285A TaxID=3237009 RepID=UPI0034D1848E